MEYTLEIFRPGSCDPNSCVKIFRTATAFLAVRPGDLMQTAGWEEQPALGPLLRVVGVEHVISEDSVGIDPAGRVLHRILVYTERAADNPEARRTAPAAVRVADRLPDTNR